MITKIFTRQPKELYREESAEVLNWSRRLMESLVENLSHVSSLQLNLWFYRNACTMCVKLKLKGQFPSNQQTGLKVSSVSFSFYQKSKYRMKRSSILVESKFCKLEKQGTERITHQKCSGILKSHSFVVHFSLSSNQKPVPSKVSWLPLDVHRGVKYNFISQKTYLFSSGWKNRIILVKLDNYRSRLG